MVSKNYESVTKVLGSCSSVGGGGGESASPSLLYSEKNLDFCKMSRDLREFEDQARKETILANQNTSLIGSTDQIGRQHYLLKYLYNNQDLVFLKVETCHFRHLNFNISV